jgi:hypothetical protein
MLTVTPTTRFPHRCFACEAPTDRTEIIKAMGYGADPWWVRALAGAAFLFKPKLFLTHADVLAGDPELFRVEVPRCAACSKKGRLAPDYVNTKQGTVTLKVRRGFAAATRALAHDGEGTGG